MGENGRNCILRNTIHSFIHLSIHCSVPHTSIHPYFICLSCQLCQWFTRPNHGVCAPAVSKDKISSSPGRKAFSQHSPPIYSNWPVMTKSKIIRTVLCRCITNAHNNMHISSSSTWTTRLASDLFFSSFFFSWSLIIQTIDWLKRLVFEMT